MLSGRIGVWQVDDADADAVLVFSSGTTGLPEGGAPHPPLDGPRRRALDHRARAHRRRPLPDRDAARRTSSGCSTSSPPSPPARAFACTRASTSTRRCARIEDERITLEKAVAPIALGMANHPRPRGVRPLLAALRDVGCDAGGRGGRRDGHPALRRALAPRLRHQRGPGDRVQPGAGPGRAGGSTPSGCPPPGVELRIVDPETGEVLPPGETGEIEVLSPSAMAGYLPETETADAFARRLVPHRRHRLARARGLGAHHRPAQGDDQGARLPGGAGRDRGGAARPTRACSTARCSACPTRELGEAIVAAVVLVDPASRSTAEELQAAGRRLGSRPTSTSATCVRRRDPAAAVGQGAAPHAQGAVARGA